MKKTLELNEIKDKKLRRLLINFKIQNSEYGTSFEYDKIVEENKRKTQNKLINYLNNKDDEFNRIYNKLSFKRGLTL